MRDLKIVLVGGGSYGWTPNLLRNLLALPELGRSEVVLHDLDPERLELTYALARRYAEQFPTRLRFRATTDQREALAGADFVTVTITTGGLRAMRQDLEVAERYGTRHTVGDTSGPAGITRALRGIPTFLQLGRAMAELCPQAWMLNCSNPLGVLTRVVNRETPVRALGVCHGVRNRVRMFASFFGVSPDAIDFVNTGIDHCSWFTHLSVQGRPVAAMLLERGVDEWLAKPPEEARRDPVFGPVYEFRCGWLLWRRLGVLPAISDRHLVEFLPRFLVGDNADRYGLDRTSVADRERGAAAARGQIRRWLNGDDPLPAPDPAHVADNVGGWMLALSGGPPVEDNLNAPNVGQVPELPEGSIVETRGVLTGAGVSARTSPLPAILEAIVRPVTLREELLIDAALEGDFDKAVAVLLTDPLVGDVTVAPRLMRDLILATREWLPQFAHVA